MGPNWQYPIKIPVLDHMAPQSCRNCSLNSILVSCWWKYIAFGKMTTNMSTTYVPHSITYICNLSQSYLWNGSTCWKWLPFCCTFGAHASISEGAPLLGCRHTEVNRDKDILTARLYTFVLCYSPFCFWFLNLTYELYIIITSWYCY